MTFNWNCYYRSVSVDDDISPGKKCLVHAFQGEDSTKCDSTSLTTEENKGALNVMLIDKVINNGIECS